MIELTEYLDDRKRSPFAEWRSALDPATRARIEIALARLGSGNLSAIKGVGSGVLEMRLQFGPGYRIYMAREGDTCILLLGGGTKRKATGRHCGSRTSVTRAEERKAAK